MEGTVKWFSRDKGFGFIQGEDGKDYFVHHSALEGIFIRENDKVSFDPTETDKGVQAQNVKLLQKGSEIEQSDDDESAEETSEESTEEPKEDSEEF